MKKLPTSQDLQSLFWLFGHFFIRHGDSIFFTKLIYLSCSFINYIREIKFMNKFIFTLSNGEISKIKVLDLE